MTEKILKSTTIVPPNLYVERAADRQVRDIVDGMGRPGYVLVARQMGKTNLLLNAKRRLPKQGDVFLYLDISNSFPDLRSFFRNVIDVAVEVAGIESSDVFRKIRIARIDGGKLPHKEHEWELRELLKVISGRLIICLDEIDAIASADFSDQVFSFIRSIYFSGRSNFVEFERLTYLLSGVAEPSEIIKNKDVSPFNIGEKIFLNDFGRNEFNKFLLQSGIGFSLDVADRVFYWTNGHPRMMWDVCSALEGVLDIDSERVDAVVRDLYFGELSVPPLDHIKKLAEESREIRDAIMSIHYGRTAGMLDSVKTKLYLAGVAGYVPGGVDVVFKNRILEEALSESWVIKLEQSKGGVLLDSCLSMVSEREYAAALSKLLILVDDASDPAALQQAKFLAGVCCINLGNFDQALSFLGDDSGPSTDPSFVARRNLLRGVSNYRLGRYQHATVYLSYVASLKSEHKLWALSAEAKIYLASAMLNDGSDEIDKIIGLCEGGLEDVKLIASDYKGESLQAAELRGFASMIIASACQKSGQIERSREVLELAISESDGCLRLVLRLLALELFMDAGHVDTLCSDLLEVNKYGWDDFVNVDSIPISRVYPLLNLLFRRGRTSDIEGLLKHIFASIQASGLLSEIVFYLGTTAFSKGNRPLGLLVLGVAVDVFGQELDLQARRELWSVLISFETPQAVNKYGRLYVDSFVSRPKDGVSVSDIRVLFLIIFDASGDLYMRIIGDAMSVLFREVIDVDLNEKEMASLSLIREFLRVRRLVLERDPQVSVAKDLLRLRKMLDSTSDFFLQSFPPNSLSLLRAHVLALVKSEGLLTWRRESKKIGRNDIVRVSYEGVVQSGKFKKFERDLTAGLCELVD